MFRIFDKQNNGYEFATMKEAILAMRYDLKYVKVQCLDGDNKVIWYRKLPSMVWSNKKEKILENVSSSYVEDKSKKIFWIARECQNGLTDDIILKQHTHMGMTYEEFLDDMFKATFIEILDDDTFYSKYSI
jgi:hypothetical protein